MPESPSASPPRPLDPLAALLSYLLPGLGQVVQGRVGKGVLFFVCLYGLFFYGLTLGSMKNVWLPDPASQPPAVAPILGELQGVSKAIYYRFQFLGQFWIGVAAWPAVVQYVQTDMPAEPGAAPRPHAILGRYMQAPTEAEINTLLRDGNKFWDLGWVYTVIAGALNILVIYDALAGPVVREEEEPDTATSRKTTPGTDAATGTEARG
ncbi:MAG: hypothetical protein LC104_14830 [Bacteroidales bacterium]|nr:hypothetical protein [Bacteroidales bacterium]